ncbi:MAG: response regulator transcription factor [Hyphomicrobiaceae bacterium]|nr:response regulator transcription factor [Hyphomicrobiaceae bacterium]
MQLLVIDDHPIVLSGLVSLLAEETDIVVHKATTGAEGLQAFKRIGPDVSIIDINLPDVSGFELARTFKAADDAARFIVFTMSDDAVLAMEALDCGAAGFISKNDDPSRFIEAIRQVAAGRTWLPDDLAGEIALHRIGAGHTSGVLTDRELKILQLLAHGRNMSEVAEAVGVSYKTVTNDASIIREKLNARTPLEMVRIAVQSKLV